MEEDHGGGDNRHPRQDQYRFLENLKHGTSFGRNSLHGVSLKHVRDATRDQAGGNRRTTLDKGIEAGKFQSMQRCDYWKLCGVGAIVDNR